jgi:hypothetical protein
MSIKFLLIFSGTTSTCVIFSSFLHLQDISVLCFYIKISIPVNRNAETKTLSQRSIYIILLHFGISHSNRKV